MSHFKLYSQYYDLLYQDKDYKREVDFVFNLLKKQTPSLNSIIDFGCGTGKHDYHFAKMGLDVTGIDLSEEMISEAKQNTPLELEKKLNFGIGDFTNFRNNKKYDAVVSLFHVMSYQNENINIQNSIKTAKAHLNKGGIFLFDCWYGPAVLSDKPVVRIKRIENNEIAVVRLAEPEIHYNQNIVDVNYEVRVTSKHSGDTEIVKEKHPMRYFFLPEIEFYLKNEGFKLIEFQEWLSGNIPNEKSWNVVFIAKLENE